MLNRTFLTKRTKNSFKNLGNFGNKRNFLSDFYYNLFFVKPYGVFLIHVISEYITSVRDTGAQQDGSRHVQIILGSLQYDRYRIHLAIIIFLKILDRYLFYRKHKNIFDKTLYKFAFTNLSKRKINENLLKLQIRTENTSHCRIMRATHFCRYYLPSSVIHMRTLNIQQITYRKHLSISAYTSAN